MIRITDDIEKIFSENTLYSKDGQGLSAKVIAKFYLPGTSIQWLITEVSQETGQWILYGYCHILESECGYVSFTELMELEVHGIEMKLDVFEKHKQKSVYDMIEVE